MSKTPDANAYRPIDCSLHDRYEAAAIQRRPVRVDWSDVEGVDHRTEGLIADVLVRDGAEYLVLSDTIEIRLDWITAFSLI